MRLLKSKPKSTATHRTSTDRTAASLWNDPLGRSSIRAAQVILLLVLIVAAVYALVTLRVVVIPVLIALILACAAYPLVAWLQRAMPAGLAAVLVMLLGFAVLGGLVTLVVFNVRGQWNSLVDSFSSGLDELLAFVENDLPFGIDTQTIEDAWASVQDWLLSSQFATGAVAGVATAAEVVTGIVLAIVVLYLFLSDGPGMWRFVTKPLGEDARPRAERAGHAVVGVLGGYVRGTAIVALVDTVFIGLGLFVLGVPLWLPLSLIVFIGAFIPIVGATAAGIVAALVALVTNDLATALWVTGIVVVVNQLEGNFLQPVVMGDALKLHPIVIVLAITAGTVLAGIIGALLSVPVAAVIWAAVKAWRTDGSDAVSRSSRPGRAAARASS